MPFPFQNTPVDSTDSGNIFGLMGMARASQTPVTKPTYDASKYNVLGSQQIGSLADPNFKDPTQLQAGGSYYADPWGFSHQIAPIGGGKYFIPQFQHEKSGTADLSYSWKDPSKVQTTTIGGQQGYIYDPATQGDLSSQLVGGRDNTAYAEKSKSLWTSIRDTLESGASLVGNYFVPGSSILTDQLVSKGSQKQLSSPLGKLAQLGTGAFGSMVGNSLGTALGQSGSWMDYSGAALKGAGSLMGMAGGTPTARQTGGGGSTMAGTSLLDSLTLGNLAQGIGGVADYATSGKQQDIMKSAYGQAQNLIMQPSPEQAAIRQKTMGMINDPSSFFQDPLYQAAFGQGQQALERSQAAKGFAGSGNAAAELQKYGQTFGADMYTQRLAQLSGLSGITQDPATRQMGAQTLLGGAGVQASLLGDKTRALTQGLTGAFTPSLQQLLSGQGGLGGTSLSDAWSGLQNIFSSGVDTSGVASGGGSPIWSDPWGTSGSTSPIDTSNIDFGNLAGSNSDYLSSLMLGF